MSEKIKLAVGYGSVCGGGDVAFTDIGTKLTELSEIVNIVYWPALMDSKLDTLKEISEIDVGIFFGAIRTEEHERMVKLLEEKSDTLVAFGACSSHGGIPGLGNIATKEDLLKTAYEEAPNTELVGNLPGKKFQEGKITLPKLKDFVSSPTDIVDFDIIVPGCPPPTDSVQALLGVLKDYLKGHKLPESYVIAEERSLCDTCEREKPDEISLQDIKRVHNAEINEDECMLKQGIICLGPVTRGGCGARCIEKNMPCRGCFGPISNIRDQGTKFLSSIASALWLGKEKEAGEEKIKKFIDEKIKDPVGLFYRFALPHSIFNRRRSDLGGEQDE